MPKPNTTGLPDTGSYNLGRGVVYLGVINTSTGKVDADGWLDLGNSPSFNLNVTEETLEHVSSREGTGTVDKSVTLRKQATITFSLDEINQQTVKLFFSGTTTTEVNEAVAGFSEHTMISAVKLGRWYDLVNSAGGRAYGVDAADLTVEYSSTGAVVVTASAPRTLTFATAGDTITASSGSFIDDGFRVGGTVTVAGTTSNNGAKTITAVTATVITVSDNLTDEGPLNATATLTMNDATLVADVDYTLDAVWGRIFFLTTGTKLVEGDPIDVTLAADAGAPATIDVTRALQQTNQVIAIKFISENPINNDEETLYEIRQTTLKADGDMSLIGNEFTEVSFTGVLEANNTGYPNSPYMDVITHSES